jgi:hypothetical protein
MKLPGIVCQSITHQHSKIPTKHLQFTIHQTLPTIPY